MEHVTQAGAKANELCILLLEDDDADAYLTGRALRSMPRVSQVVRARNGQEAVSMLESGKVTPDIGFIDLQMPTLDGLSFLNLCMDRGLANIPLVVLTSSSDWKDALRSRVHGALSVITKPENPVDLKQALQDAIDVFAPGEVAKSHTQPQASLQPLHPTFSPPTGSTAAPLAAPQFGRRQTTARS